MRTSRGVAGLVLLVLLTAFGGQALAAVVGLDPIEPSGEEQLFIWLLNRARSDPPAYAAEVGLGSLLDGVAPQPPLALNKRLVSSARGHTESMAANDDDGSHFGHYDIDRDLYPNEMVRATGYVLPASYPVEANWVESLAGGTVADAPYALKLLIEDLGWDPPGHREHMLGMTAFFQDHREIGVGHSYNAAAWYTNYWAVHTAYVNTSDRFLTGVVYDDLNSNRRYDAGEGLGGVTVDVGSGSAVTGPAGGYAIPVTDDTYSFTVSGGSFTPEATATAVVSGASVEVDFISGDGEGIVSFGSPPVADISPSATTGYRDVALTMDGSGSFDPDPGGSIDAYAWTSVPSAGVTFGTADQVSTTVTFTDLGSYDVTLEVTDKDLMTDTDTVTIQIVNKPPTINAVTVDTAPPIYTADGVDISVDAVDDDGSIVSREWETDGDGLFDDDTGASITVTGGWADDGAYTVRVRVTDDDGGITTDSVVVNVLNRAPTAAGAAESAVACLVGETIGFVDDGSTDPDGQVVTWSWDFDTSVATDWPLVTDNAATVAEHYWTAPGTYYVRLTVTDDDGATDDIDTDIEVTVSAAPDGEPDNLPDNWELEVFGVLDEDDTGDGDGDGLTNLEEFQEHTDPTDGDSDDDGISDGDEVDGPGGWGPTDPNNPDSDGDGYSDKAEVDSGHDPNDAGDVPPPPDPDDGGGGCSASASGRVAAPGGWMLPVAALGALLALWRRAEPVRSRRRRCR